MKKIIVFVVMMVACVYGESSKSSDVKTKNITIIKGDFALL